jgi:hypothetical protein
MLEKKALAVDKTVPTIQALILLDNEGKRIAVDYFSEKLYVLIYTYSMYDNDLVVRN